MPPKAAPKPAAKATKAAAPAPKAAAPAPKEAAKPAPAPEKKAAPAASAGNGVYVKNLGDAGVESVTAIFSAAGAVSGVRLRRNKYAIVFFQQAASVKKAIETFNGKDLKGQKLSVVAAKSGAKADKKADSKVVFVAPIFRGNTTKAQAKALFAGCGKITKMRTYHNNCAFVYFDSAAAAQKAVKDKDGQTFKNNKLRVKLSGRSAERDAKRLAIAKARSLVKQARHAAPTKA